ncbi:MAG: lasso peptide biosynthesis PqqD family chaperone [Candidatus Marinimicrobia bacterium]|nr:lasso peptide biosynthesis PqqD family chaperone [Candidatus Neomarinimicrobiota bacterium]
MSNASELHTKTVVHAIDEQVSSELDGESVILSLENGVYYGLDEVGAFIWERVQQPVEVSQLIEAVLSEYDVAREECTKDVLNLLGELQENGLIQVEDSG